MLGPVRYQSFKAGLIKLGTDLDVLQEHGFIFEDATDGASKPLAGMSFVITGTLVSGGRDQVAAKIEAKGGLVKNSVSKNNQFPYNG